MKEETGWLVSNLFDNEGCICPVSETTDNLKKVVFYLFEIYRLNINYKKFVSHSTFCQTKIGIDLYIANSKSKASKLSLSRYFIVLEYIFLWRKNKKDTDSSKTAGSKSRLITKYPSKSFYYIEFIKLAVSRLLEQFGRLYCTDCTVYCTCLKWHLINIQAVCPWT